MHLIANETAMSILDEPNVNTKRRYIINQLIAGLLPLQFNQLKAQMMHENDRHY